MSKKHRDQDDIDASRSVKRMNKESRRNKKKERGWHKAAAYRKPDTEELIFEAIPGSDLFHPIVQKKKKWQVKFLLREKPMQYRNIDNVDTNIKSDDLQRVEEIIQNAGFENKDTTHLSSGLLFVYPVPANGKAAMEYKGLLALAPYLTGTIILEETADSYQKRWIHLIFKDGMVEEKVTPPHQWEA